MNFTQIEKNLQKLMKSFDKESFIYELLLAYGSSASRFFNLSKNEGEIIWKKKLYFKEEYKEDLRINVLEITKSIQHNERYFI